MSITSANSHICRSSLQVTKLNIEVKQLLIKNEELYNANVSMSKTLCENEKMITTLLQRIYTMEQELPLRLCTSAKRVNVDSDSDSDSLSSLHFDSDSESSSDGEWV